MSVNEINDLDQLRLLAHDYRVKRGYENGVVFFCDREIGGWCTDSRFAESDCVRAWVAGVIAIESDGAAWIAKGGNYQEGATHWDTLKC